MTVKSGLTVCFLVAANNEGDTSQSHAVTDIDKGQAGDMSSTVDTAPKVDPVKCDSGEGTPMPPVSLGGEDQQTDQTAATVQEE